MTMFKRHTARAAAMPARLQTPSPSWRISSWIVLMLLQWNGMLWKVKRLSLLRRHTTSSCSIHYKHTCMHAPSGISWWFLILLIEHVCLAIAFSQKICIELIEVTFSNNQCSNISKHWCCCGVWKCAWIRHAEQRNLSANLLIQFSNEVPRSDH